MARDRANIRTDMWGDSDWRGRSIGAQWLYMYLLTSPSLSYVGVADWRPARIAPLSGGMTADMVRGFAAELEQSRFAFVDESTEEVLVRSFLKHDGLLLNPNMWKSIGNDFAGVGSEKLRGVVAEEGRKLRNEFPEGMETSKGGTVNPWSSQYLSTLLDTPSHTPGETPSREGLGTGYPTATATTTATEASLPTGDAKLKETRLPSDWVPSKNHYDIGREKGLDIAAEADAFRLHAETHDRHAARWNAAFTTWLKKAKPKPRSNGDGWMNRSTA